MRIAGRGIIGESSVLHVPRASANLMSSKSIVEKGSRIVFGQTDSGRVYCEIICIHGRQFGFPDKVIEAVLFNELWWITKAQMLDSLICGGLTVEDLLPIKKSVAEAHLLAENHSKLVNGHESETKEDYAHIYRVMQVEFDNI